MFEPPTKLPRITAGLLLAMLVGAVIKAAWPAATMAYLGLTPTAVLDKGFLWQVVSYLFIHGSLLHLLFNCFALYLFGSALERIWGETKFLVYFLICGLGAAGLTLAISPNATWPTVGASGAIFGLLLAWAKEFPDSILYIGFILPVRARHFIVILCVLEFLLSGGPSPIARFAHLGGLAAGFLYFFATRAPWAWVSQVKEAKLKIRKERPVEDEIDRILDKIRASGLESLTSRERKVLEGFRENLKKKN